MFENVSVSALGVILGAIVYFIIGAIWYSPFLFGKECMPPDEKKDDSLKKCCPCKISSCVGEFILSLVIAFVTAHLLAVIHAKTLSEGVIAAFWLWIGYIATTHFSAVLWARKTMKHFFIHTGFMLIGLLAMGAVLSYFVK